MMRSVIFAMSKLVICSSAVFLLSACSDRLKHKIGLTKSAPNEYSVQRGKPLDMPPHFELEEIAKTSNSGVVTEDAKEGKKKEDSKSDSSQQSAEKELLNKLD